MALNLFLNMEEDFPELPSMRKQHRTHTVASVSTTASSREESSDSESDDFMPLLKSQTVPGLGSAKLSAELPQDLIVRNGFYEFKEEMFDFMDVRRTQSAPSTPYAHKRLEDMDSDTHLCLHTCVVMSESLNSDFLLSSDTPIGPTILDSASILGGSAKKTPEVPRPANLGTAEMPTLGSAGHFVGECRPCAFFWKVEGCGKGVECRYCHLCDRKEKKRRQKDRKNMLKALAMAESA
jgi:hypothetical protein